MIDSHHHFWRLARGDYLWLGPELAPLYRDFEPDDLAPDLSATGVTGTILVQAAPTAAETEHLLAIAAAWAPVLGVVGWADLAADDAAKQVEAMSARAKLVGLRPMIQDEPDPDWMLRPEVERGLAAMATYGLRLDALVRPLHLARLARLADRLPDLPIVLDHGGKPDIAGDGYEPWSRDLGGLARRPNVWCKLSGLLTEAGADRSDSALRPYVDRLLETFGPERLMWGSDWPVLRLAGDYQGWAAQAKRLTSRLDEDARDLVFRRTALRFYGLEDLG